MTAPPAAFLASWRSSAVKEVTDLTDYRPDQRTWRVVCWAAISGKAGNLKEREPQPNLGAAAPGPGWNVRPRVFGIEGEPWPASEGVRDER